jgi:hypothetical protein
VLQLEMRDAMPKHQPAVLSGTLPLRSPPPTHPPPMHTWCRARWKVRCRRRAAAKKPVNKRCMNLIAKEARKRAADLKRQRQLARSQQHRSATGVNAAQGLSVPAASSAP